MPVWTNKKYILTKTHGFNQLMKAIGVRFVMRKIGNAVVPAVELLQNGDIYTLRTTSAYKDFQITFRIGEEFDEVTVDGRKVKSVLYWDEDKLIQKQRGEKPMTIVREFFPDKMITTLIYGDIQCVRHYRNEEIEDCDICKFY